jgi:hypothetical protein
MITASLGRLEGAVKSWGGYWELRALFRPPDHAVQWLVTPPEVWKAGISIIRISLLCAAALSGDDKKNKSYICPLHFTRCLGSHLAILLFY